MVAHVFSLKKVFLNNCIGLKGFGYLTSGFIGPAKSSMFVFNFCCCCCCCCCCCLVLFHLFFHLFLTDQNKTKQRTSQNREKLETQYPSVQAESNTLLNRCLFLSVSFSNLNELNRPEQEKSKRNPRVQLPHSVTRWTLPFWPHSTEPVPPKLTKCDKYHTKIATLFSDVSKAEISVRKKIRYEISDKYCLIYSFSMIFCSSDSTHPLCAFDLAA